VSCYHRNLVVTISTVVLLLSTQVHAALQRAGSASVEFTAVGPAGLRIVGKTNDLAVADAGEELTIAVSLTGLETGIALRDKHMREKYLEVEKYPDAKLTISRNSLKFPNTEAETHAEATGNLHLHGKSKPVPFSYRATRSGGSYHVTGNLRINIRDFDIAVPNYLGVTVKPDVDVKVAFDVTDTTSHS